MGSQIKIKAVFWDCDNTLLDFVASSRGALIELSERYKIPLTEEEFLKWYKCKDHLWDLQNRGELTIDDVVRRQFDTLLDTYNFNGDRHRFNEEFQKILYHHAVVNKGAITALKYFYMRVPQYIASNGYLEQQHERLRVSGLLPLFDDLFVSNDIDAEKPTEKFFNEALRRANVKAADVLMIGDNIITDIEAAHNIGMHTCWYNPNNLEPRNIKPDFTITKLFDIRNLEIEF